MLSKNCGEGGGWVGCFLVVVGVLLTILPYIVLFACVQRFCRGVTLWPSICGDKVEGVGDAHMWHSREFSHILCQLSIATTQASRMPACDLHTNLIHHAFCNAVWASQMSSNDLNNAVWHSIHYHTTVWCLGCPGCSGTQHLLTFLQPLSPLHRWALRMTKLLDWRLKFESQKPVPCTGSEDNATIELKVRIHIIFA